VGALAPLDCEIISKKGCFFNSEWQKIFTAFGRPWKKFWENSLLAPLEKILPTLMISL